MERQPSELDENLLAPDNSNPSGEIGSISSNATSIKTGIDRSIPTRQPGDHWNDHSTAIHTSRDVPPAYMRTRSLAPSPNQTNAGDGEAVAASQADQNNQVAGQDQLAMMAFIKDDLLQKKVRNLSPTTESLSQMNHSRFFTYYNTSTNYGEARTTSPSPYSPVNSSPLSETSHSLSNSLQKSGRKLPEKPYKVLNAPELRNDYYLNLLDWSSQNVIAVGLNSCVYLYNESSKETIKLCDLGLVPATITSVQWSENGEYLAVGTGNGTMQIWDVSRTTKLSDVWTHAGRIGSLAWNGDQICSGSWDRTILMKDFRTPDGRSEKRLTSHVMEVCGLKWSPDKRYLASGGNDNQVIVWGREGGPPVYKWGEHKAAVKALAWSPHERGLLISGAGTADRCLRTWNTQTGQAVKCVDTGSQVCTVAWSKHGSELVTTHGFENNHVAIWKYPSFTPVAKLTGHTSRVFYMAMSPDGESVVTGAGDETLRFWHLFCKSDQSKTSRWKRSI